MEAPPNKFGTFSPMEILKTNKQAKNHGGKKNSFPLSGKKDGEYFIICL